MKSIYLLLACFFFYSLPAFSQKKAPVFQFRNGLVFAKENLLHQQKKEPAFRALRYQKNIYGLIQFEHAPDVPGRRDLLARGIKLFDYLPGAGYLAEFPESSDLASIPGFKIRGFYGIEQKAKVDPTLLTRAPGADEVVALSYYGAVDKKIVIAELIRAGAVIVDNKIKPARTIFLTAPRASLLQIARLPFVSYLGRQSLQLVELNNNSRAVHGVDVVSAPSGRNLQGQDVTIGMGDNADPTTHIDFSGRLILRNSQTPMLHGTHTTGTAGGAGILNPRYKGMAPHALIVSQAFNDILNNASVYIRDYNMVLTNNSYFQGLNNCPGDGEYDALSNYADSELIVHPSLLHVFACGNDGSLTCTPFPKSYGTIKSGFQTAKNVLTVGAIDYLNYGINTSSSRGPVNDGRIKPEITASGTKVMSTMVNNTYGISSGTSMAAPAVTGSLALMYQRYRQLYSAIDPEASVIKALICNSADDLGNAGPDYTYGFGMLNVRTAMESMENHYFYTGALNEGDNPNFLISSLPAGVYQLKIMLYWPDAPAAPFATSALVNDLDLTVTAADGVVHRPLILNPSAAQVNALAVEGEDHLNNIEQVVINNPSAGNVRISIKGTNVPFANQEFAVVYQIIRPSVTIEYPAGDNTLVPGESENIRWSAYGGNSAFTVDYSTDNGGSWTVLNNNVPSASRLLNVTVPNQPGTQALVRVTRNGEGYTDQSDHTFTILQQPVVTATNPCPGYGQLIWNTVPLATAYQVMKLTGDSMQTIATITDTSFFLTQLNKDSSYWFGVRPLLNGEPGRRSISVNLLPSGGPCSLPQFNNDMTITAINSPVTGRMYTSSALTTEPVSIVIKNLGNVNATGPFNLYYQVNQGLTTVETVTQTLNAGSSTVFTFSQPFDFSAAARYDLRVWVDFAGDSQLANDTLDISISQLKNDPLVLSPSFTEGFESALPRDYIRKTIGLAGLDRADFFSTPNGRLRSFVNTGFARTGDRSLTLDQAVYNVSAAADSLVCTFNLSNYTNTDQIWLDYYVRRQALVQSLPGNSVWIRGDDQSAWIMADSNYLPLAAPGVYKAGLSIDVTGILAKAIPAQTITSSFQVKFGEEAAGEANDVYLSGFQDLEAGLTFDDVMLTRSSNDVGILSIDQTNFVAPCGLSAAEPIKVQVKNYSSGLMNNVAVAYSVNGVTVTEIIPTILAGQTITYTFAQPADLSRAQLYTIKSWVHFAADNYNRNDSLNAISFHTVPTVNGYPYLQHFDQDDGGWYADGLNNNWAWGTPDKTIINRAASGDKAWVTGLTGNYTDNAMAYLYSPCFDLTGLSRPVLSFSHIFRMEDDCDCDHHWVEYSTDNTHWQKLDSGGTGTNWYDDLTGKRWVKSYTKWHVSSHDIPVSNATVRFRFAVQSDPAGNFDGVGIDDVHVFDKAPVYDSLKVLHVPAQSVSGANWIHFESEGKRVVSVNPLGQDLGITSVSQFVHQGAVRDTNFQYYLDRNIVVQPSIAPLDTVLVRFYFTDSEAVRLINAVGCAHCSTIADAYLGGVTQYSSPVSTEEDSTLNNNVSGNYGFFKPGRDVSIVPYDNGYYAEYRVTHFSEFWINGGGYYQNQALPLVLDSFTAVNVDTTGVLRWTIFDSADADRFIIEKSIDGIHFTAIDSVNAIAGQNIYHYTDRLLSQGTNYYRIRVIKASGQIQYSAIRSLVYNRKFIPTINQVYPNPVSTGRITVNTVSDCKRIELYDVLGRFVRAENKSGLQNQFSLTALSKGVYIMRVTTDAGNFIVKIVIN